jgi:hypothetical protein
MVGCSEASTHPTLSLKYTENEFYYYILMLKARALAGTNEKPEDESQGALYLNN